MTDPRFTAAAFIGTKYDTAEEKAKVVNDTIRFLRAKTPLERFTKPLYNAYSLHFGHIAHYDKWGFHAEWFETAVQRLRFVAKILEGHPWDFSPDWSDVRDALTTWLRASDLVQLYVLDAKRERNAGLLGAAKRALDAMPEDVRADFLRGYGLAPGEDATVVTIATARQQEGATPIQADLFAA